MNALFKAIYNNILNSVPSLPDIVYVVGPSYITSGYSIETGVFFTKDQDKAQSVRDLLNKSDNDIISHMHYIAHKIVRPTTTTNLKFKITKQISSSIEARIDKYIANEIPYDFLMTECFINQVSDKLQSSIQNDFRFNPTTLEHFRKSLGDKHIV